MEYRRCQPPCSRSIASDDPHSKLAVFERESSVFPRRAPEAAEALRESTTWGSDVELEAMESEQTGFASSLPLSPEHVRVNSPVEFAHEYLCPSPEARDSVSFGLDDILFTAASDSEDFGPALTDALPPSGQEARPSAAYSELVDVLSRATEKLSIDWPNEPRESQSSKLDERFLSGPNSRPERRKLPFFSDLHHEISRSWKQPFSSRLTNAAAADFTNLVGSVEQGYTAIPVIEDTLASHLSPSLAPSWKSRPLLPTKPKSYIAAVGRRIKLSPPTSCSFVTRGSRDRRHFRFSPTAFGHRGLHQPNQGHHRLSFVVDDITPSRPSRHPNSAFRQKKNKIFIYPEQQAGDGDPCVILLLLFCVSSFTYGQPAHVMRRYQKFLTQHRGPYVNVEMCTSEISDRNIGSETGENLSTPSYKRKIIKLKQRRNSTVQ
ncbi:hypothetical protein G5714_004282 [Onychostoma macrolepis]|uniref:Uncharacterized protein n=1 Tax=Onychostoma macrolepis TaxID=369639 RepID=A0A7J6D494_9TELE|nr:hypothetical protein G5714_004282 [Onychostoma macrolepis]